MRTIKLIIALLVVSSLMIGCQKNKESSRMVVKMTDDPASYSEVNVNVQAVQIHYENEDYSGWHDLHTNKGFYNLLALQNDVSVVIADEDHLPVGHLNQMRLILGPNNHIVTPTDVHPLELSSQDKTGLKLNIDAELKPDESLEILFDFDAGKSIVEEGNGRYRLKPVLKVEHLIYTK